MEASPEQPLTTEDSMELEEQSEAAAPSVATGGGGVAAAAADDDENEKLCRYCFDDEEYGELLSPCDCSGGQKWVHLSCLRRWQRMVLVTQPTHPRFWQDDVRHHQCNVCKAEFTCAPPSRHELMESFTGPELAALIEPGCVIGAHKVFSAELASQLESIPPMARFSCGYEHWIGGCYLITSVVADDGEVSIPVEDPGQLDEIRSRLGDALSITIQGTELTVQSSGSLEGVPRAELGTRLAALSAPCTIVLGDNTPKTCGDDSVCALNLTRPIGPGNPNFNARELEQSLQKVRLAQSYGEQAAAGVLLEHYDGGPVEAGSIVTCVVVGGNSTGWSTTSSLRDAVLKAYCRAAKRAEGQGGAWLASGQTVCLQGLQARPDLNGEIGIAIRFSAEKGRWLVKVSTCGFRNDCDRQYCAHGRVLLVGCRSFRTAKARCSSQQILRRPRGSKWRAAAVRPLKQLQHTWNARF